MYRPHSLTNSVFSGPGRLTQLPSVQSASRALFETILVLPHRFSLGRPFPSHLFKIDCIALPLSTPPLTLFISMSRCRARSFLPVLPVLTPAATPCGGDLLTNPSLTCPETFGVPETGLPLPPHDYRHLLPQPPQFRRGHHVRPTPLIPLPPGVFTTGRLSPGFFFLLVS